MYQLFPQESPGSSLDFRNRVP